MDANKPLTKRQIQVSLELKSVAQTFFQRESSGASLITVTNAEVSPDLRRATFFISVLPENKEEMALSFAKRMRSELRDVIKKRLETKVIPHIEVELDYGEKKRQYMDEIFRKAGEQNKDKEGEK